MIPDFVLQVQEIERNFSTQAEVTHSMWQDSVSQKFFEKYVQPYNDKIHGFIYGHDIYGLGLDELLQFMEQKQCEMAAIDGGNIVVNPDCGDVHDSYRNRVNYQSYDGIEQPGNQAGDGVEQIMYNRASSQDYGEYEF